MQLRKSSPVLHVQWALKWKNKMPTPLNTENLTHQPSEPELYSILSDLMDVDRAVAQLAGHLGALGIVGLPLRIEAFHSSSYGELRAIKKLVTDELAPSAERREALKASLREAVFAETKTVAEQVRECMIPIKM